MPIQSDSLTLISHVAGLVPRLAGHVELQLERHRVVRAVAGCEVVGGAAGALECLDLADEDAVHQRAGRVGGVVTLGRRGAWPAPRLLRSTTP